MTESLGIDLVINPELEAAKNIKQNIDYVIQQKPVVNHVVKN